MEEKSENLLKRRTLTEQEKEDLLERLFGNKKEEDFEDDSDEEIPYAGKVYLARRYKPDSWACIGLQVAAVVSILALAGYAYFYFEHMHINVLHGYAHLGYDTAQHELGNRYLNGIGVEKHEEKAMEWFQKAADQGHPHASYNLAIGHLKGIPTNLNQSEIRRLIQHAADHDVHEAKLTLYNICGSETC